MLTKILFTLAVIIAVVIYYRMKNAPKAAAPVAEPKDGGSSLPVRTVTYALLAVLIVVSATIFVFKYRADNRIVTIHVVAEDGSRTVYQARQKHIKGRQFLTLDEKQVTLGESDRFEIDSR